MAYYNVATGRRSESQQVENYVESYLQKECEKRGAKCVKNYNRAGWPDRTVYWFCGVTDLIETKRPKGGRYEPLQLHTHDKLRRMGHSVLVVNTRALVDKYIASREKYSITRRGV